MYQGPKITYMWHWMHIVNATTAGQKRCTEVTVYIWTLDIQIAQYYSLPSALTRGY